MRTYAKPLAAAALVAALAGCGGAGAAGQSGAQTLPAAAPSSPAAAPTTTATAPDGVRGTCTPGQYQGQPSFKLTLTDVSAGEIFVRFYVVDLYDGSGHDLGSVQTPTGWQMTDGQAITFNDQANAQDDAANQVVIPAGAATCKFTEWISGSS